ncbi:MAG: hypothetical protein QXJ27_08105, partial [Thermoplasmata archaeon]
GYGWAISEVAIGTGALLGGFLANHFSLQFPILLSGIIILFSTLLPVQLPCPKVHRSEDVIENLKQSIRILRTNRNLYILLLIGGVYAAFDGVFIILKQPFMYYIGLTVDQIGLIYLAFTFVGALGSFSMYKLEKTMGRGILALVGFLPLMSVLVMLLGPGFLAVVGVIIVGFTTGLTMPLMVYYVNLEVLSERRGVMLSYMSIIYTALLIPLSPLCGFLADISIQLALSFLLCLCVPYLVLVAIAYKKWE